MNVKYKKKNYENLSILEQYNIIQTAFRWENNHRSYVKNLIRSEKNDSYPPSGSDMYHPELWKPTHWKWLIDNGWKILVFESEIKDAIKEIKKKGD